MGSNASFKTRGLRIISPVGRRLRFSIGQEQMISLRCSLSLTELRLAYRSMMTKRIRCSICLF